MKLSKDQKFFLKYFPLLALMYIVFYPLMSWLFKKPMTWEDFLISALTGIAIALVGTLIYVLGAHVPTKDD